ncbi:F0F1 ATP synthase subunit epsilon [Coxiella burnetii]|uniref:ATP synthase epsilon chain n=5 Tax=Coxiella burnetii TaxID=777 RepID=ATPE_COXBU|nr:F0F1 ATP synthase subunit epsilon [Coxiella burnetii]NP_820922.1 ATP synthase subunit epsilon [Coxiella burnetii RSA 493]A9KBF5.1 RecName: Full=ATP synthase epsilon chain; AltName: Full=ATP synthase F1 sector epsilon subunit; AltName: Full=F-ATPase epsilon subunit [Coxiella burnetii Dugway 5J108-111]A9NBD2.1 RecName: Full=ATP synthase epsilon chain; AltName: Full=ATP synthase F1 sector epsilon subunit; AltName: Full=F-ATPase epsilon subunit [Coxiella burnetii RSA 331]B6J2E1.1 RecName: Full=A
MAKTMQLEIVSAEAAIFSGKVEMIVVTGGMGELGIYPGHRQLLTSLKPGQIKAILEGGKEEVFYMSGGMLEVQPEIVTILADTALRAVDLDEAAAISAKEEAERRLAKQKAGIEYSKAMTELAEAAAQLRAIQMLRKSAKKH